MAKIENEIFKVKQFGTYSVYERKNHPGNLPRYFVLEEVSGKILEEFRGKPAAFRWATDQMIETTP